MKYSSNITIQNCSFQHSTDRAVVLSDVSRAVSINHCNFMDNSVFKGHGAAIYHSLSNNIGIFSPFILTLRITHCNFSLNKGVENIVYIDNKSTTYAGNIIFLGSVFYDNQGVSIYVVNQNLQRKGKLLFQSNKARNGPGIYIKNNSTVKFCAQSNVTFSQNISGNKGGAVFLKDHSNLLFDQNSVVNFNENKAKFGAIYSNISSNVTFTATLPSGIQW